MIEFKFSILIFLLRCSEVPEASEESEDKQNKNRQVVEGFCFRFLKSLQLKQTSKRLVCQFL